MGTLLLIDGHSQAYRAYFGVKAPLTTRDGEPTTAVFGFMRKLLSLLKEHQPDSVAVAFDSGDTWRHAEFEPYKATRDSMPPDLHTQIARLEQVLQTFNIPVVTYENYEADDILGTLAYRAAEQGEDVLILTGDRDMFQLVSDKVKILYTRGGPNPKTDVYGMDEVAARYELHPDQFVELKALVGDSSDNLPGIAGVGEKTAIKFLKQFETIENLYQNVDQISGPKTRQNVSDAHDQVLLNRRLMTIVTDLDLEYNPERFQLGGYDHAAVVQLFTELEFRSLLRDLPGADSNDAGATDASGQISLFDTQEPATTDSENADEEPVKLNDNYLYIQDEESLAKLVASLNGAKRISFDVETTSTDAMSATLVGLGLTTAANAATYIPVAHQDGEQLPWETVRTQLQPFFMDPNIVKMAHNGKYDLTVCKRYGLDAAGPIHDTMTMAWILDPGSRSLGLKAQAALELGWQMTEITDLIGTGRKQITIDHASIEQTGQYCGADVDATLQLYDVLGPRLRDAGMWELYRDIELPLLPILTEMEMSGILLDVEFLQEMSTTLAERLLSLEQELFEIVGREFNLRSTQQLSQVLFDELEFPSKGLKRTSSGFISTAVSVLERLRTMSDKLSPNQRRVLEIIFEQRQLEKLRGTYVDALPALVNAETGRVHTSFNQTGAITGRMSSSNPNLQNIPIRTELGRKVRRAFIAPPGWQLIAADYSQVELRILAHVVQEELLLEAFAADQDIHIATASRLFDVPLDDVDYDQRGLAKTINYATIYGISAFGLSNRTDMNPAEAGKFLDQYFETYPKIKQYIADTIEQASNQGYVETLHGRKRFFPELQQERLPFNQRQSIERAAINAPIQGTAADIMKIAMKNLHTELQKGGFQARMLLQVHDELVLEVPDEERLEVAKVVEQVMESAYTLSVPLRVDVEAGPNWYTMSPVE